MGIELIPPNVEKMKYYLSLKISTKFSLVGWLEKFWGMGNAFENNGE